MSTATTIATTDIDQGVVGVFDTMEAATAAITELGESDFPIEHVSVITQNLEASTTVHGFVTTGDVAASSAGVGAWVGGLFGILGGAALLLVPGVGPVIAAGSLAAVMIGGAEGAVGGAALGGLVGAATGHFVAKKHIAKLTEHLKGGKYLLVAQSTDPAEVQEARRIISGGASEVIAPEPAATS